MRTSIMKPRRHSVSTRRALAVARHRGPRRLDAAAAKRRSPGLRDPKVLRFSIIPTQESVRELTLYKPVLDLLSKNTGKKIEFYMPTSYASVVEALLGKWVDIAVLGPESYVIANNHGAAIEVFATYTRRRTASRTPVPATSRC